MSGGPLNVRPLKSAEEISAAQATAPPFLRLPDRASVFADRAARLRQLASAGAMRDYLLLIARLADIQQAELDAGPPDLTPSEAALARAHEHGMPPLGALQTERGEAWQELVRRMFQRLAAASEEPQAAMLSRLAMQSGEFYELQAAKLLAGVGTGLNAAAAPVIGAALQVCWTSMATRLGQRAFPKLDVATVCPCCGSQPVASIVRIGREAGHRYLRCSLCAAEWHMVRVKCAHCESTRGIHYQEIEGGASAVKAECCDACGSYLKIVYMDKDPAVDPVADDLASLTLDLLLADQGKAGVGVNFMLVHMDTEG